MNNRLLGGLITSAVVLSVTMRQNQPVVKLNQMTLPPTPTQSLEEQAGFTSPVLEQFQQKGMRLVNENISFSAYGHDYRLLGFVPIGFVPTGTPTGEGGFPSLGAVMLFQLNKSVGTLLWRNDVGSEWPVLSEKRSDIGNLWPAPGDWEKNGQLDFAVEYAHDTTCPFDPIYMYVLGSDGTVTSRFKHLIPLDHVITSIEIQKDGSLLLTAQDERGKGVNYLCVFPDMHRYLKLHGTTLTDVSADHQEDYDTQLGQDIFVTTTWKSYDFSMLDDDTIAQYYSSHLMEILLIYDALGKRDAGYHLVQELATDALQSGVIKPNTYLDQVFLPAMAQLYQQKLPFVDPAYVGPNPLPRVDYYQN